MIEYRQQAGELNELRQQLQLSNEQRDQAIAGLAKVNSELSGVRAVYRCIKFLLMAMMWLSIVALALYAVAAALYFPMNAACQMAVCSKTGFVWTAAFFSSFIVWVAAIGIYTGITEK